MATLKCPEKTVRRLCKELNYEDYAKATPKKLEKYLHEIRESLNGDSVEDMDVSGSCKSLMEEVVEAIDEETPIKVIAAEAEEEAEDEDETPKKKTGKMKKAKTQVKTKTPVKKKLKKRGASSSSSTYDPEKAAIYQKKRRKEDHAIEAAITKSPKTLETLIKKLGYPESRVKCHLNVWKKRSNGDKYYKMDKKTKQYSIAE